MSLQNKILAGGLALQAVILIIVFWPSSSSVSVEKLLPGLVESQITELTISDSAGSSIRLRGSASGCVLPEADDYPCETDQLTSLTRWLVDLSDATLVAKTAGSHRRLRVAGDEFDRLIEIQLADGSSRRIYLGGSSRRLSMHARLENRNEVYLASGVSISPVSAQATVSVQATSWVEPVYFSVSQEQVVSLTQENARGRLRLEKDENGVWSLPEENPVRPLAQAEAQSLVRRAARLPMLRPLGIGELDSYGLQAPAAVVTIGALDDDGNSKEYVLRVGTQDADEEVHVLKSSESPYHVLVRTFYVRDFVNLGIDALLEPPSPTITGVSPSSGTTAGGTAVTITGTDFSSVAAVTFGDTAATAVTVVGDTNMTATTPAHAAETVDVVVTNDFNRSGTLTNGYTFVAAAAPGGE